MICPQPKVDEIDVSYAEWSTRPVIEIHGVLLNMCKVSNVYIDRKARSITFKMRGVMSNIFINDDDNLERLSEVTKISSKGLKNFLVFPMQDDIDSLLF